MKYISDFLWEKNLREVNEDSLSINQLLINGTPCLLAIICDGMGGLSNGDVASDYVVNVLKSSIDYLKFSPSLSINSYLHFIKREIYRCHKFLSSLDTACGTTLSLLLLYNKNAYYIHAGDTRLYIGTNKLKQIGKDHKTQDGKLTFAVGIGNYKRPKIKKFKLKRNMKLLLCSDGFYKANLALISANNYFTSIESESHINQALEILFSHAANKGECDNASAIMIYVN